MMVETTEIPPPCKVCNGDQVIFPSGGMMAISCPICARDKPLSQIEIDKGLKIDVDQFNVWQAWTVH